MKDKLRNKDILVLSIILGLLACPLTGVVLLRSTALPRKQVKRREKYPTLMPTLSESDKLRVHGLEMTPSDVERIRNEGRQLKVTRKSPTLYSPLIPFF